MRPNSARDGTRQPGTQHLADWRNWKAADQYVDLRWNRQHSEPRAHPHVDADRGFGRIKNGIRCRLRSGHQCRHRVALCGGRRLLRGPRRARVALGGLGVAVIGVDAQLIVSPF